MGLSVGGYVAMLKRGFTQDEAREVLTLSRARESGAR